MTLPSWNTSPEADWLEITTEEAGLDPACFRAFLTGLDVEGASFPGEDRSESSHLTVLVVVNASGFDHTC